ncbi:MAG: hypothetical protein AAF958_14255 [Planctomycetota bacterium]
MNPAIPAIRLSAGDARNDKNLPGEFWTKLHVALEPPFWHYP